MSTKRALDGDTLTLARGLRNNMVWLCMVFAVARSAPTDYFMTRDVVLEVAVESCCPAEAAIQHH